MPLFYGQPERIGRLKNIRFEVSFFLIKSVVTGVEDAKPGHKKTGKFSCFIFHF